MSESLFISWNELYKKIKNKDVYLFGAGESVKKTLEKVSIKPLCIIDNDPEKKGQTYLDVPIDSPEILNHTKKEFIVLITSSLYDSISNQLSNMGLIQGVDFFCTPSLNNLRVSHNLKNINQKLLFTNGDVPHDDKESGGGLFIYDFNTKGLKKIKEGKFHEFIKVNNYYYVIEESKGVFVFNEYLDHIDTWETLNWSWAHGISADPDGGKLFVANTGRDSVSVFDLQTGRHLEELTLKIRKSEDNDLHHINDIYFYEGNLYISMFSFSGLWKKGVFDGGIAQINPNTGDLLSYPINDMWMPHSIKFINNEILFANSMHGDIYKTNNKILFSMDGFARGITFDGEFYYFGISEHRYFDRLQNVTNNIQVNCGIFVFDPEHQASRLILFDDLKNIHSLMILGDRNAL